ncbi:MAG: hypothetical protein AB1847_15380 [bacterium]
MGRDLVHEVITGFLDAQASTALYTAASRQHPATRCQHSIQYPAAGIESGSIQPPAAICQ